MVGWGPGHYVTVLGLVIWGLRGHWWGQGTRSHKWTKSNHLVDKVILLGLSSFVLKSSWHCLKIRTLPPPNLAFWPPWTCFRPDRVSWGSGVAAHLEVGPCPPFAQGPVLEVAPAFRLRAPCRPPEALCVSALSPQTWPPLLCLSRWAATERP